MGVRAKWLVDAARLTGYPVNVLPGCFGRGHGDFRVLEGVMGHHTAGARLGDYPSLIVVRDGRAGLDGPLSNYGLARSGTIQCIADGVCYHAGASRWAGFVDLNDEFIGIEAESVGTMDDWTEAQRDCYPRLVAAALYYMRRDASRFCGHKEGAIPLGRKVDPAFWNLPDFRSKVAWYLVDPLNRIPRFANPTGAPVARKARPKMIERELFTGENYDRIVFPVGKASGIVASAFLSISCAGGFRAQVAFQVSADTDGAPPGAGEIWRPVGKNASRLWRQIPDGTEFLELWVTAKGPGSLLIEPVGK